MIRPYPIPCPRPGCDGLLQPADGDLLLCHWCGWTTVTRPAGGSP